MSTPSGYYDSPPADPDHAKAIEWYLKAAELGSVDAMYKLGDLYSGGKGVDQGYAKARKWYEAAAAYGHPFAIDALKKYPE